MFYFCLFVCSEGVWAYDFSSVHLYLDYLAGVAWPRRGTAESGRVTAAAGTVLCQQLPSAWLKSPAGILQSPQQVSPSHCPQTRKDLLVLFLISLAPTQVQAGLCLAGHRGGGRSRGWGVSPDFLETALHSEIITLRKRSTIFPNFNVQTAMFDKPRTQLLLPVARFTRCSTFGSTEGKPRMGYRRMVAACVTGPALKAVQALPLLVAPMAPGTAPFSSPEAFPEVENLHPFLTGLSEVHLKCSVPASLTVGWCQQSDTQPGGGTWH